MYIETSYPRKKGDKARLISGDMPTKKTHCFTFFYHMYGWSIGKLALLQKEENRNETQLWYRDTPLGNKWHQAYVSFFGWNKHQVSFFQENQFSIIYGRCQEKFFIKINFLYLV